MKALGNIRQQIEEEVRRLFSENDTQMVMVCVDEKLDGLADQLEKLNKRDDNEIEETQNEIGYENIQKVYDKFTEEQRKAMLVAIKYAMIGVRKELVACLRKP